MNSSREKINIFWFRRDLRLDDNTGLNAALDSSIPVLPVFIFDRNITDDLHNDDARVSFIYDELKNINEKLAGSGSGVLIKKGTPLKTWEELISEFNIGAVFFNRDYEPYSIKRDAEITELLKKNRVDVRTFKDQVIFEEKEIQKPDGGPYTMFTPYKKAWLKKIEAQEIGTGVERGRARWCKFRNNFPALEGLEFRRSQIRIKPYDLSKLKDYNIFRDFPAEDSTTHLGPHLRFGTVSIRRIIQVATTQSQSFLDELIWREFFMQILFNFQHVVTGNFRSKYDNINWRNNENEFLRWCNGETGYPLVDAGMRQLNETGYMHSRVRMIAAGFLCKHLLTAWWYGEAYFAGKLNDYELSSNNGNWQWVSGTGCDAAQYFRVFNPVYQQTKFDPHNEYVRRWIPESGKRSYPKPIVEHAFARERAINAFRRQY
ncbi:MAG TPA: deoxyribodipyrimidine photo-lyase [Bacteroidales bacterium]|nr:deoxyribodipyrimidine photo-lyase [Bacteroidales bacterium]